MFFKTCSSVKAKVFRDGWISSPLANPLRAFAEERVSLDKTFVSASPFGCPARIAVPYFSGMPTYCSSSSTNGTASLMGQQHPPPLPTPTKRLTGATPDFKA